MIPVSLRLKNFMSYGTEAPVLDFEQFQVACLSGRNGQGKSALLDALTWALWGEARKSSDARKPDDELLRIGTLEMEVELVFDVEGERYRVVRSYSRSASGKTSKPGLEFAVSEPGGETFRPLTAASMRETQTHIDAAVGLDYDTFINSSFLLQGRSDEFTKKRPSERKQILASILNLSRYERLADLAGERERASRAQVEQCDQEIERLQKALESEDTLNEEAEAVQHQINAQQESVETLRAEERRCTEALATLEARAQAAAQVEAAVADLRTRIEQQEADAQAIRARQQEAQTLLDERAAIQQAFERYHALQKERDDLDAKNELFRAVEKQLERKEQALRDRIAELERELERASLEQQGLKREYDQCVAQLAEEPALRRKHAQAQAAHEAVERMRQHKEKRDALRAELEELERTLHGQREGLVSRIEMLGKHIAQTRSEQPDPQALAKQRADLEAKGERRAAAVKEVEAVEVRGKDIAEQLHKGAAQQTTRTEQLARLDALVEAVSSGTEEACPTCGTELTPSHRADVLADLRDQRGEIADAFEAAERSLARLKADRDVLRQDYRRWKMVLDELEQVPEQRARLEAEEARAARLAAEITRLSSEQEAHQEQLENKTYGTEERARYRVVKAALAELDFDEDAFAQHQEVAASLDHLRRRLRELEELAGRKEQLTASLKRIEQRRETLCEHLASGADLKALQADADRFREQLQAIGFDADRFREVKRAQEALKDAPDRMSRLNQATLEAERLAEQLTTVTERLGRLREEHAERVREHAAMTASLGGKEAAERRLAEAHAKREAAEEALHTLQQRAGQVHEKLAQAARDRDALKSARADRRAADADRALYRHLRAAFGKHGIPSLIIEQTLPEIEDRTNELLDRLTDGKMSIRLETLKEKKSGPGTKETLEIRITDEQGVSRPYETFSGGEAFRVNFALRLALAQLLAERSGVRIRTLVVDEGFGTQDAQGVQNLVEAINQVQADFDKIVVITHLDELKEAFPVRIEVTKDPVDGSRFEVLGV